MLIWVYLCDYKNASFFRRMNRCINIYINLLKDAKENWLDRDKILHLTVGGMLHQGECWTSTCNGIKSDLWESLEAWEIMLWDFRQFQHFVGVAFLWLIHAYITFPPEILLPVTFPHLVYVSCFFFSSSSSSSSKSVVSCECYWDTSVNSFTLKNISLLVVVLYVVWDSAASAVF